MAIEVNITGSGGDLIDIPSAAYSKDAQSWEDAGGFFLSTITVQLSVGAGNPGNIALELYAADANQFPTGSLLASALVSSGSIASYPSFTSYAFDLTGLTIAAATKYTFVVSTSAGVPTTDFIYIKNTLGNPYAGGQVSGWNGSSWVAFSNEDITAVIRSVDNPDLAGTITGTSSVSGTLGMAAKNPNPANAFSGMGLDWQTFSWESGSSVPPADEVYNVYFGTSVDNLSLIVSEGPDINFAAAYLAAVVGMGGYSSTYYWRVDTYFQNSQETIQGDVWSFSTIVFDFPPGGARGVGGGFGGDDGSGEAIGYGGGTFGDKQIHTKTRLIGFARNTLYYENL